MTSISEFEILKRLGEGSFGSVYQVKRKSDDKLYAMKKVKMLSLSTKEKENALNEVRILASIKSENIVSYKDAFYDEKSSCLCIIMEFATKGDVLMQINEKKKTRSYFDEQTVWKFAADMLVGLKSLHDKKILHRDLKGANVFIAEDGSLKLGDLNVSKVQKRDFAYTQTGTPYYTSPEVWQNRPYDYKCDVWSFGCVLYEIVTLEPPFKGISMEDLYKKVLRGNFSPINFQRYSSDLQKFIEQCLKVDPRSRASVEQLLTHKNILPFIDLDTIAASDRNKNKNDKADLLKTIKLPYGNNLKGLNNCLPKPNYDVDEKIEEQDETEIKTDQIISKKGNQDRPYSAVEPTSNLVKNNLGNQYKNNVQNENIVQNKARDNSANRNQNYNNNYNNQNNNYNNNYYNYSPQQQQGQRIQSAQNQIKRVLSNNDISPANQGKYYMPPIQNNNKQQQNYHYYNQQQSPSYQPKIAVHQQKDTVFSNMQRQNSKEALYRYADQYKNNYRRQSEDYQENIRNIGNVRPYQNDKQTPVMNKQKLQPLAGGARIPGSPQMNNAQLPPKPLFKNY